MESTDMDTIDLRSDTVSWPTPEMREAMASAVVGDDVYNEDPTVNALQEEAAAMLGKEAALFVTSGTMGNLTAIMTHCQHGDEIIVGREAHIFLYEAGGSAALAGVQASTVSVETDGTLNLESIRKAIRPTGNPHFPRTRLVCLENTQGSRAGRPISAEYTAQVGELAHANGLKLHIDGARIFNAAAALAMDVKELAAPADSISFCLSKGLCAPAGSLLVGSRAFIDRALYIRKLLGGGMRQVGILAAAGQIALRKMTERLAEDHANACRLAEGLATIPHIDIDPTTVHTNMILFSIDDNAPIAPDVLVQRLKDEYNIVIGGYSNGRDKIRFVTHYWITQQRVDTVIEAMRALLT